MQNLAIFAQSPEPSVYKLTAVQFCKIRQDVANLKGNFWTFFLDFPIFLPLKLNKMQDKTISEFSEGYLVHETQHYSTENLSSHSTYNT